MNINIALCDDQKLYIDGVSSALKTEQTFKIIGHALTGKEFKEIINSNKIDVVVLDLFQSDEDGIQLVKWIHQNFSEIKILILTVDENVSSIRNALSAGALGYLPKNTNGLNLITAIKTIYTGISYIPNHFMQKLVNFSEVSLEKSSLLNGLTERELQVLKLITQEYNNAEIAKKLYLSVHTINSHRKMIFKKLNVNNVVSLIKLVLNEKMLDRFN